MDKVRDELKEDYNFFLSLAEYRARSARCKRNKCGAIITKEDNIIGKGVNSPAGNKFYCEEDKKTLHEKVVDKTCCQHAERNAMDKALSNFNKEILKGSIMFFGRVNGKGESIFSGDPYCTKCSKDALGLEISKWVLRHESGIYVYDSEEYHELSRNYN